MKRPSRKQSYLIWRKRGLSYQQIADKYGVCWQAVYNSVNYVYKYKSQGTFRKSKNKHMNKEESNPLDVLTNPDREAEKRGIYERVLEKTQAEQESVNTPDTEWEKEFVKLVTGTTPDKAAIPPQWIDFIQNLISSRDTYWKERVKKEVESILSITADAVEENTAFYEQKYGGNYEQCGRDIKFSIAQDFDKEKSSYELLGNRTVEEYCEHIKKICTPAPITNEDNLK